MRTALVLVLLTTAPLLAPGAGAAGTPPFVPVLPCGCTGYSVDLSTASYQGRSPIAVGMEDDGWYVVSTPLVETPGHHAAYSVPRETGWAAPPPSVNWLGDGSGLRVSLDGFGTPASFGAAQPGEYVYAIDFDLDLARYAFPSIGASYAADDAVEFSLNDPTFAPGSIIASSTGSAVLGTFSYAGPLFVDGPNTLYAKVTNVAGPTGLLVMASLRAGCRDSIDLATGVRDGKPDPRGATDDSWFLYRSPVSPTQAPAYSIPRLNGWIYSPNANWIGPIVATNGKTTPMAPAGIYVYEFDFTLECIPADCSKLHLLMEWAADDAAEIRLNDFLLDSYGMTTGYAWLRPHAIDHSCSHFALGKNVLTASVWNSMAWTGFIAQGQVTIDP